MSVCNEHDAGGPAVLSDRLYATVTRAAEQVAAAALYSRDVFIRRRRLRATEAALDGLPDNIRSDIGWPDLYKRQIDICNLVERTRRQ